MPVLVIADGQGSGAALVEEGRILAAAKQHRWASCYLLKLRGRMKPASPPSAFAFQDR